MKMPVFRAVVGVAAIGLLIATTGAAASAAGPRTASVLAQPAYVAGHATVSSITFNPGDEAHWHCTFSGWAGTTVNFDCPLEYEDTGVTVVHHKGSFSGGSYTTPTYSQHISLAYTYCARAIAAYSDGSASASGIWCG